MLDVGALFEAHHEAIVRFLVRRTNGDRDLAEELAQQVWLKVHRMAVSYEERGLSPRPWLYRIARNLFLDHTRAKRQVETVPLEWASEPSAVTADAGTDRQADRMDIEQGLARLTPLQAAVIRARFLRGQSIRQISEATGTSEDAVKKMQARGLVNLRRLMKEAA